MQKTDYLSHLPLEWNPICPPHRRETKLDVFKHSLSATDGLPPYAQARIIDLISNQLRKVRPHACLWVSVDTPGNWYLDEIRRLVKGRIPTAILPVNQAPIDGWDFHPDIIAYLEDENDDCPRTMNRFAASEFGLKDSSLRILRILARLRNAHTPEITSLAGYSETYVRKLLKEMRDRRLVEWKKIGKYDSWEIKTQGLRLAHRSWNLPKKVHFAPYRREFRYAGEHHRRVSRMWRAWLETAYPSVKIWECWTEVSVLHGIPDALAWGRVSGWECLFWLEVDSGHSSRKVMERNYGRRLRTIYTHSYTWQMPIVVCILGPRWVVEEFKFCIPSLYPSVAIIGHDWREFGKLPTYEFGQWHEDLDETEYRHNLCPRGKLSFNPAHYPSKTKTKKISKLPKQKSDKPRFIAPSTIENEKYWGRDPYDL